MRYIFIFILYSILFDDLNDAISSFVVRKTSQPHQRFLPSSPIISSLLCNSADTGSLDSDVTHNSPNKEAKSSGSEQTMKYKRSSRRNRIKETKTSKNNSNYESIPSYSEILVSHNSSIINSQVTFNVNETDNTISPAVHSIHSNNNQTDEDNSDIFPSSSIFSQSIDMENIRRRYRLKKMEKTPSYRPPKSTLNPIISRESTTAYYRQINLQPSQRCRMISYDHLATSSILAFEALPYLKRKKGDRYMHKWWAAAKKWDLLSEEMKRIDKLYENFTQNSRMRWRNGYYPNQSVGAFIDGNSDNVSSYVNQTTEFKFRDNMNVSSVISFDRSSGEPVDLKSSYQSKGKFNSKTRRSNRVISEFSGFQSNGHHSDHVLESDEDGEVDEDDEYDDQEEEDDEEEEEEFDLEDGDNDDVSSTLTSSNNNDALRAFINQRLNEKKNIRKRQEAEFIIPYTELYQYCENHHARLICIGDVHGCVDEVKDLLKKACFCPGDLVLFLGDLIAKGPSSIEVIQLAMAIGAMSVRGNHDQEVIRQSVLFGRGKRVGPNPEFSSFVGTRSSTRRQYSSSDNPEVTSSARASIAVNGTKGGHNPPVYSRNPVVESVNRKNDVSVSKDKDSTSASSVGGVIYSGTGNRNSNYNDSTGFRAGGTGGYYQRVTGGSDHLKIALKLSSREFKWLSKLPYYVASPDLGSVFVHAGFQMNQKLVDQDPWNMMTMRSVLPDGKPSPRCFYKFPWADKWRGPLTVYFGHDAARGLQMYDNAMGLDTGCVYGGQLSAILLPDKIVTNVPARKAYLDFGKSRSHRMYLCSRDNSSVVMGLGLDTRGITPEEDGHNKIEEEYLDEELDDEVVEKDSIEKIEGKIQD